MSSWKRLKEIMDQMEIVDLSHTLEQQIPTWHTHSKFLHTVWTSYLLGDRATTFQLIMNEHNGTHVDAPAHFIRKGDAHLWINEIPLGEFLGPYVKMDMSHLGSKAELTVEDLLLWEKQHGGIEKGDIILFDFGWAKYWKKRPEEQAFIRDWPGIGESAAAYLVEKGVKSVGVDTINIEVSSAVDSPAHYMLLGNKILIMENLNNLDKLPERGYFMGLPLNIMEGSGSPVRAIAFVEKNYQIDSTKS